MNDSEDGDLFDEIAGFSARQTLDEEFVAAGGTLSRYKTTGPGSPVKGTPIPKLEDQQWWGDRYHLSRDEERELIRKAKAGDPSAKDRFYKCFNKKLIKVAGNAKYGGPP